MLNDAAIWKNLNSPNRLFLIAGPCVIESEKLCLQVAASLKKTCASLGIFYVFKARSLEWVQEVYRGLVFAQRIYFTAWFSPRRFKRSRRRRCNGGGVLGLKATKYHSGWLRSRLSHASVGASAFGCRATFSRIAP